MCITPNDAVEEPGEQCTVVSALIVTEPAACEINSANTSVLFTLCMSQDSEPTKLLDHPKTKC
jgi:hypothetical protein